MRWYSANTVTQFYAGGFAPDGVAFDGQNIWVASNAQNSVSKIRANDGAVLGTFKVGNQPGSIAFDGANMWVTAIGNSTISKVRCSDGKVLGTYFVNTPFGVVFDGTNIWVSLLGSYLVKLRTSDGEVLQSV